MSETSLPLSVEQATVEVRDVRTGTALGSVSLVADPVCPGRVSSYQETVEASISPDQWTGFVAAHLPDGTFKPS